MANIPAGPATALPSGYPPAAGSALVGPLPYAVPPAKRRSRLLVITAVIVAIVLVIGAVGFLLLLAQTPVVDISDINVYTTDNVCGLNGFPGYYGFTSGGGLNELTLPITNGNTTSCTIEGVTTNTSGFEVTQAQVPLDLGPGANSTLNVTIEFPSSYQGVLNLIFS